MILVVCWKDHSDCSVENGPDGIGLEASRAILKEALAVSTDKTMVWVIGTRVVIVEIDSKYGVRKEEDSREAPRFLPKTIGWLVWGTYDNFS